jgi:hypothetical protein
MSAAEELPQLTRADLARMAKQDPGSVERARQDGQLEHLLTGRICPTCGHDRGDQTA